MSNRRLTLRSLLALCLLAPAGSAAAVCVTDSVAADFAGGSGCYVSDVTGGEVALPATLATEFSGGALPAGWATNEWTSGGSVSVSGGVVTVIGYEVYPDPASYTAGRSLEFVATFPIANPVPLTGQKFQTIGFGRTDEPPFNNLPLLAVGTFNQQGAAQGNVNALVWESGTPVVPLHAVDGLPHRYRIDWNATTVSYFVDGVLKTTQPQGIGVALRPAISSFQRVNDEFGNINPLVVDWLRVTPYTAPCSHESALRDSGASATDWSTLASTLELPAGTGVTVETRTGNTTPVDGTWSAYQPVSGGLIASPRGRYLQYRLSLSSADVGQTPAVDDVAVCYEPCTPSAEVCDGVDNDCDDLVDEGDPGGGAGCSTGLLGVCAAGITECSGGTLLCNQTTAASAEVCDGLDNDCDGAADDGNPGGNLSCSTGLSGVCAAGTTQCSAGSVHCVQNVAAGAEVCDGVDNDCDGSTDEGDPGGGGACSTGNPGICAAGVNHCQSGAIVCVQTNAPAPSETCNGLDDNCNGATDEGNPGGNLSCSTGLSGVCAAGTTQCSGGSVHCNQNVAAGAETCDGLDNDCDGSTDEDDPGGGGVCNTGNQGVCALGVKHCQSGALVCVQSLSPTAETCNGLDDNCNGTIDEGNPGGNLSCSTGLSGVCAAGTTQCSGGSVHCNQNVAAGAETCDGLDNDCDGSTDEGDPGGGGACATGNPGICAAGVNHCQSGALHCVQTNTPAPTETCNGLDDNCNGSTDEGDPGGGGACTTGTPGICAAGVNHCLSGAVQCVQTNAPHAETCNSLDDDCDGSTDEGNPGGGAACSTGQMGVCDPGTLQCIGGSVVCQANQAASPELCNNLDDNCNGVVDEGNPGGGVACATGQPGVCALGTTQCLSHTIVCQPDTAPSPEICDNGLDENCAGGVDEEPCALCPAADTVALGSQTKIVLVKLSDASGSDKLTTKGTLVLPQAGAIDPAAQSVTVKLTDGAGGYYTGTIPAGQFVASGSGRSFKFSDVSPYPFDGMQHAIVKIGGDMVTTKYLFKARGLDLAAFVGGTGTLTVKIGNKCFEDDGDTCTVAASGKKVKCR